MARESKCTHLVADPIEDGNHIAHVFCGEDWVKQLALKQIGIIQRLENDNTSDKSLSHLAAMMFAYNGINQFVATIFRISVRIRTQSRCQTHAEDQTVASRLNKSHEFGRE